MCLGFELPYWVRRATLLNERLHSFPVPNARLASLTFWALAFGDVAAVGPIDVAAIETFETVCILEMVGTADTQGAVTLLMVEIAITYLCRVAVTRTKDDLIHDVLHWFWGSKDIRQGEPRFILESYGRSLRRFIAFQQIIHFLWTFRANADISVSMSSPIEKIHTSANLKGDLISR